ncbi:PREDICTED: myeloid differentiation primary response protein MyD88 [Cyphomyrmex costatus]|uniref:Myeloid differentiation primary response protein MyD88 n=1 Tax=Cyphomyrmex costatus TaxID=456900 RepID=A0A195CNF4_9HYME|nr:PREDICTED: myeloid differentiation primary response protein MyD88 [Cyphomyrmex costatus]KYN02200.1 Myeloid differentiation primary response protein MyD88 [Cyphomyrmex costatus]
MTIDLSTVPLAAATVTSRQVIATMLNPVKVLPSDNGLPRDWRGLAHQLELSSKFVSMLVSHSDPTMRIFTELTDKNKKDIAIKDFQAMMEQMDRWDIIDDTEALFQSDAERYLEHEQKAQISVDPMDECIDKKILTLDDIHRLKQDLGLQYYDAFLLYAEEDIDFVNEMIEKLEVQFKLKLCLKDRDLVAGLEFEHEAVMELISERCNRLLIIVSPNLMKHSTNKFFLNYTQALSIEKRQRKIIPCIYKSCELPFQLKYIFNLDYNRKGLFDFWGKLRDSIQAPNSTATCSSTQIGNNSIMQETTEVKKICSDKYSDIPHITQETNKETIKSPQHKNENCKNEIIAKESNIETLNVNNKKNKTFLRWEKITSNLKTKQIKKNDQLTTEEIVQNLPSVNNLDSLDLSSTYEYKKKKKNLFSKFTKKKIPVKT